jgi:hypothetical protein
MAKLEEENYESVLIAEHAVKSFRVGIDITCLLFFIKVIAKWKFNTDISYFWVTLPMYIGPVLIATVMTIVFNIGLFSVFIKELRRNRGKRNGEKEIQPR